MKLNLTAVAVLALAALPSFAGTSRYLVSHAPREARGPLLRDADAPRRSVRELPIIEGFAADLTDDEVAEARANGAVVTPVVERHLLGLDDARRSVQPRRSAEGVERTTLDHTAADAGPYANMQAIPYGIDMVRARNVWPVTRGSAQVHVAILDTGIDSTHPDLKDNYGGGWNTFTKTPVPTDDFGHGTHVAGTIAAEDNGFGVVGVAPNVHVWAVKVLDNHGSGADENIVDGLQWVLDRKAQVGGDWIVSLSLGSHQPSAPEEEAFQKIADAGILAVAAAGNDGFPVLSYPAAYPSVVSVAALEATGVIADFSNSGSSLNLCAPGVGVLSTVPVKSATVADVGTAAHRFIGAPVTGSPKSDVTGKLVYCGLGNPEEFPAAVKGEIALIQRGTLTFNQKVRNAVAAGAAAVVIYNNTDTTTNSGWTLIPQQCTAGGGCHATNPADTTFPWPLTISVSNADGEWMRQSMALAPVSESLRDDDYEMMSGTSMATPHVAGVAALVWSLAPDVTATQLRAALEGTAHDLGTPGWDPVYGFGLVDATAAAHRLAPQKFGDPALPPPAPGIPHGRISGH